MGSPSIKLESERAYLGLHCFIEAIVRNSPQSPTLTRDSNGKRGRDTGDKNPVLPLFATTSTRNGPTGQHGAILLLEIKHFKKLADCFFRVRPVLRAPLFIPLRRSAV